ncbi:cytochrome P450 family protein [Actinomadura rubrobrunea]|uniref:hypothetical protein n=1 Tax=Actinomadura rubrobrunea TaxID=115335 RepID=UPI0012FBFEB5|nr:hypothetical protein [Actinomadura rubrobrunea]
MEDLPPYAQLYSPEFHADPEAAWQRLREGGRVAWVALQPGVLTLLVLDHNLIVSFSRDTTRWTRKTTRWNGWGLVDNSEIAAMISEWRNMLFAEGPEHERLRAPVVAALKEVDMDQLRVHVEQAAMDLIGRFAPYGRADLVAEFAVPLPLIVMSRLFGLDEMDRLRLPDIMRRIWDADDDAGRAADDLVRLMDATVRRHQQGLGHGPLTKALVERPGGLSHDELAGTLVLMVGAGSQPAANLIANTVAELLADPQLHADVMSAAVPVADAVHHTLWARPPITHYPPLVARCDLTVDSVFVPQGTLALLGLGPAGHQIHQAHGRPLHSNRGYVAFGVGPHQCPASLHALVIAQTAVTTLVRELPDLRLAVQHDKLAWRPSPFARALHRLDVKFTPRPFPSPRPEGTRPSWQHPQTVGHSQSAPTSTAPSPPNSSSGGRWFLWPFRGTSQRGR